MLAVHRHCDFRSLGCACVVFAEEAGFKKKAQKANNFGKVLFPLKHFLVGNYGLRTAERWDGMPNVSSEVGEI